MSVIAAALKHMLAANMPHDAILLAVEDMERGLQTDEQAERRRAADRERQRERRLRISAESADKNDSPRASVTRVEDNLLTSENTQKEESKNSAPAKPSPRQHLEAVLDPERAESVIELRKRIKAPLTARAAQLLARDFAKWPDPNAAADEMVKRGWRGFEPSWMPGQPRAGPVAKPNAGVAAVDALMEKLDAVPPSETQGNPPYLSLVALSGGR